MPTDVGTTQVNEEQGQFVSRVLEIKSIIRDTNDYLDELEEKLSPYSIPESGQSGCGIGNGQDKCKLDNELDELSSSLTALNGRIRILTDNFQG